MIPNISGLRKLGSGQDYYSFTKELCNSCLSSKEYYFEYLCKEIGLDSNKAVKLYKKQYVKERVIQLLETRLEMPFRSRGEEKDKFIQELYKSLGNMKYDKRNKGIRSINILFQKLEIPYQIISKRNFKQTAENRGETYWKICKKAQ